MDSQSEFAGKGTGLTPQRKGSLLILTGSTCISFAPFFIKEAPTG